jgi:hypothetical protein
MVLKKLKIDYYLTLLFFLIIVLYKADAFVPIFIIPILLISYYRIIIKQDFTIVLILMLSARLMMGPLVPKNPTVFNIVNLLCNYIPIGILLLFNFTKLKTVNLGVIKNLKWTILFVIFILIFSLFSLPYSFSVFAQETLPLVFFLLAALFIGYKRINFNYLLKFFRYSFLACVIIYLSPHFYEQSIHLFLDNIIFKDEIVRIVLKVARKIPRNTGFVFDFRIMGQLSCIYLLLLYYTNKKKSYWDIILLSLVCISTFSRGPMIILVLLFLGIYLPEKIRITKRLLTSLGVVFLLLITMIIYALNNETIQNFVQTLNPLNKDNAISQRGMFIDYSFDRFYENPLGNGIGSLSAPGADVEVFAGYTNFHKKVPDKVVYTKVGDAYLALSLAEKGIIGFILMILSLLEIFYSNKNRVSLFFTIGLFINLIGTDIPKQGFFYFTLIIIYYGLSQTKRIENPLDKSKIYE